MRRPLHPLLLFLLAALCLLQNASAERSATTQDQENALQTASQWFAALAGLDIKKAFALYDFSAFEESSSAQQEPLAQLKRSVLKELQREIKYTEKQWRQAAIDRLHISPQPLTFVQKAKLLRQLPESCRLVDIHYQHLFAEKKLAVCRKQRQWRIFPDLSYFAETSRQPTAPRNAEELAKALFAAMRAYDIEQALHYYIAPDAAENPQQGFPQQDAKQLSKALDRELEKNAVLWKEAFVAKVRLNKKILFRFNAQQQQWQCQQADVFYGFIAANMEDGRLPRMLLTFCHNAEQDWQWAALPGDQPLSLYYQ